MNLILVLVLQLYNTQYGNPYHMYINPSQIVSLTSHVEYVCEGTEVVNNTFRYTNCSNTVKEVCEVKLGYRDSIIIKQSCKAFANKLRGN